jgi:hypothetical protein
MIIYLCAFDKALVKGHALSVLAPVPRTCIGTTEALATPMAMIRRFAAVYARVTGQIVLACKSHATGAACVWTVGVNILVLAKYVLVREEKQ